jgi:hypothetical protein
MPADPFDPARDHYFADQRRLAASVIGALPDVNDESTQRRVRRTADTLGLRPLGQSTGVCEPSTHIGRLAGWQCRWES